MRPALLVALLVCVTTAGCGPNRGGRAPAGPRRVVVLQGQPACTFRPIRQLRVVIGNPGIHWAIASAQRQARQMGAHAVVDFHRVLGSGGDQAFVYEGTAVHFSDPSNPECYR